MTLSQMDTDIHRVAGNLRLIRERKPLIHNITNYVVMNPTANALLALGASPVMAHAPEEVEEMVGLAGALVINIGTLSTPWVDAMLTAVRAAAARSLPTVLDPVGAGATRFRTETARRLMEATRFSVIRGNPSEILALAGATARTRGVDSADTTEDAASAARDLALATGSVVAVTGAVDLVVDACRAFRVHNGHRLMGRVTGTGCAASAITGAFCAVESDPLYATVGALVTFGIAGELAAQGRPGPGSFQVRLLDGLDALTDAEIVRRGRIEELDA